MTDNRRMRQFWLPAVTIVLLLGGCSPKRELPRPAPSDSSAKLEVPAGNSNINRKFDDFNLPLVIEIVLPEVPPEIQGPSPPIQEEPKPP